MDSVKYFRHGDVHIIEIKSIPSDATKTEERVLEYGEVTGHAHRLGMGNATLFIKGERKYLRVVDPVDLTHEEHETRAIPPGDYEIRRTRETDHMAGVVRAVAD
jgi:hypothetical protein